MCKSCCEEKKYYAHGMCRRCYQKQYYSDKSNRIKINAGVRECRYKRGGKSMSENKSCPSFLGVHIAENVLSKVFKDVKKMPPCNPGYDFICKSGKKIDVKSSCIYHRVNRSDSWAFSINKNKCADYFLCLAFDNRDDLNPLHIWLIPSWKVSMYMGTGISESTLFKWNEYKLDIGKVLACCDSLKA